MIGATTIGELAQDRATVAATTRSAIDDGCYINPVPFGCLDCPLAFCVYDVSSGPSNYSHHQDGLEVRKRLVPILWSGSVRDVAQRAGVSPTTVSRVRAEVNRGKAGDLPQRAMRLLALRDVRQRVRPATARFSMKAWGSE